MTTRAVRVLATIVLLAPPLALLVLFFGGEQVVERLGCPVGAALHAECGGSVPGPIPIIGTNLGAWAALALLGVAWLGAGIVCLWYVAARDRRGLFRAIGLALSATAIAGVAGFVAVSSARSGLRGPIGNAILWAFLVGFPVGDLALAVEAWLVAGRRDSMANRTPG
jgi:hypothetical protein